jgi:hypothetical protein
VEKFISEIQEWVYDTKKNSEEINGKNWTTMTILLSLLGYTELHCTKATVRGVQKL